MKIYTYNHKAIHFDFKQTVDRFFVEEIPLFRPSGQGNYLILKIRKSDMSTWKLIHVISKATGLQEREIGYAGLKDKSATTIQYISIPKRSERDLKNLTTEKIVILAKNYHKTPIKIGQLKGNRFSIKLYSVTDSAASEIEKAALEISKIGIPNYFGYQRFGEDGRSYLQGKAIVHSGKRLKGAKEKLLAASYQGYLFNQWLSERIKLSKIISEFDPQEAAKQLSYPEALTNVLARQPQFFKLFIGDLMMGYPYGKEKYVRDMLHDSAQFRKRLISPTGLICGAQAHRAKSDAYHIEASYDDEEFTSLRGDRRFAWIWPEDLKSNYGKEGQEMQINFTLPKGAYATTLLEEIGKTELKPLSR